MKQVLLLLCSIRKLFSLKEGPQPPRDLIKTPPSWDEILTWLLSEYVEHLNVLHFPFPVPVVTLVWLQEFFNEVVIHKHIYCLQLTRITFRDVWAVQVTPAPIKTISNSEQETTSADSFTLKYTLLHAGTCGRSE